jgi:hypothetical protein
MGQHFLFNDRPVATNTGRVTDWTLHHTSASYFYSFGVSYKRDHRRHCESSQHFPNCHSRLHLLQKRHRADDETNHRKVEVLRAENWISVRWMDVIVGDIVKVLNNTFFPADLILLSSR